MSVGGVGIVSIISHVVGPHVRAMVDAAAAGDYATARKLHWPCCPPTGRWAARGGGAGLVFAKAALRLQGFGVGDPRLPQIPATHHQTEQIARDLDEIGPLR